MTQYDKIDTALKAVFSAVQQRDGVSITTQCLYPSNGFVRVTVRGGENSFFASDEGGAVQEIEAAGAEIIDPDRLLRNIVKPLGLVMAKGVIISPAVGIDGISVAVALVANASKEAADWLFAHTRTKRTRDFKALLAEFLRVRYDGSVHADTLLGQSNKPHKFDNLINLPNGKKLILDPVTKEPASINARVVANMDIRLKNYPNVEQRIIYDDEEDWRVEDLSLLQVGAPVVAFSQAAHVLDRLAA